MQIFDTLESLNFRYDRLKDSDWSYVNDKCNKLIAIDSSSKEGYCPFSQRQQRLNYNLLYIQI